MIPVFIPVIQKADALILRDRVKESAYLGIAVNRHFLCEERVRKCEIRVILSYVFLIYDQVGCKIQNKPGFLAKSL